MTRKINENWKLMRIDKQKKKIKYKNKKALRQKIVLVPVRRGKLWLIVLKVLQFEMILSLLIKINEAKK